MRFGEPLDFSRYHGQQADAKLLRTITDEIMQAIAKLSGQEYVDIDARRAKAELAAEPNSPQIRTKTRPDRPPASRSFILGSCCRHPRRPPAH